MKKFILIMVFILLTALLIVFNYLLWDRENKIEELKRLEYTNASNNASINAQKREIENLVEEVGKLGDIIDKLESENTGLNSQKNELVSELDRVKETLQQRINFINVLKEHLNIDVISEPLTKWVGALNQGNYEEAYDLEYAGVAAKDRTVSLSAYTEEMKKNIRKIDIIDVKIDKLRGAVNGDIYLNARLNVKLNEEVEKGSFRFIEGENEVYVKIDYSYDDKKFFISEINIV